MTTPKRSDRQSENVRKGILKKLASGGIKQSDLVRMFPNASTDVVRSAIEKMRQQGQVRVDEINGWNVVSLPPANAQAREEVRVEPILPKVEPILPKIEPLSREPGVFVPESPERLILGTLSEGARMRESLIRLVAGQMNRDEANKLLDRMVRSGILNETRSGRMSIVQKPGHE